MRTPRTIKKADETMIREELGFSIESLKDWEWVSGRIKPRLMDTREKDFLKGKAHTFVADIPVVYVVEVGEGKDGGFANAFVPEGMLDVWGKTIEELDAQARANLKGVPNSLNDVLTQIAREHGLEFDGSPIDIPEGAPEIMVLTNDRKSYGASELLNDDLMRKYSILFGGEVAVIPSSVHEVLLLPANAVDVEAVNMMIQDVNASCLSEDDILSDKLYIYNPESGLRVA